MFSQDCCKDGKKCEIVCDGTVMATITNDENGINIKPTKEAKEMCCKSE